MIQQAWQYMIEYPDKLLGWTWQHLQIVLIANAVAVVLGVLIGMWVSGKGREQIADGVIYVSCPQC